MANILVKFKALSIKFIRKTQVPFVSLLVLFTIVFSLFRAMTPWVAGYKTQVIAQISAKIGQKVDIESLETSWYWFKPVLKLNNVKIFDVKHHKLHFDKILIGINLWGSLWHRQIEPGIVYIGHTTLDVHQQGENWFIDGLSNQSKHGAQANSKALILAWLLAQDSLIVKQLSANIYLTDGNKIMVRDFNFKAVNANGHYKIYGQTKLLQTQPTSLAIIADLQLDTNNLFKSSGSVYLSLEKFLPEQWLRFLPKLPYQLNKGLCDLDLWLQIKFGAIKSLQAKMDLQKVFFVENNGKTHDIDYLAANMAWRRDKFGWSFVADKTNLILNGIQWPQNQISLTYNQELDSYNLFIANILLDSLRTADIDWPKEVQRLLAMHPIGILLNTQLHIQNKNLNYLLTRFKDLGWDEVGNIPAVQKISGAVYWDPHEGRLVLDGEQTKIVHKNYPSQTFDVVNADIYWKELNNGLRIDLDRFVLNNQFLTLSASGVLDNFQNPDSNLRLHAEFSAQEAQQFMAYIPAGHLKPKFEEWLKKDVRRIKNISGKILVNGSLDGFPYDTTPGKFIVKSHVAGVDLAINDAWPLNQDINADLEFNKRSFTANVDYAKLQALQLNKVNLAVNNIGYGTESLLIHAEVEAPGPDIKSYIYATPLKAKFSRWKNINIEEGYWVDLKLDIPLYPENDHVAALGEIVFSENPVHINFAKKQILVKDVAGSLKFNEYGLTDGEVTGVVDKSPLKLQARAMLDPQEKTELIIDGETTIETLRKLTNSNILSLLSGSCPVSGVWTIYPTTATDDTLHLETNLQGVTSSLPAPLKKSATDLALLSLDFAFKNNNTVTSKIYFNKVLNSNLLFADTKNGLSLVNGYLKIGDKSSQISKAPGLKVLGEVKNLDVSAWQKAFATLPKNSKDFALLDLLSLVDVNVKKLKLAGKIYKDLAFKADKKNNKWIINIHEDKFIANLEYAPKLNNLSGKINNLSIDFANKTSKPTQKLKIIPKDIPNLNLEIENLSINNIDAGVLYLRTTSKNKALSLDNMEIKSPYYNFSADGLWTVENNKNKTNLQFNLKISDLAKSLEKLNITPVVSSKNGIVNFEGSYPRAIYDFNIQDLAAYMTVVFKNGRISHFDKNLEEKIGLAKILSILSLQTIPRRLKLDFSDLSENGYTFDIFKGDFAFANGVMNTKNSYIDGPVAYAKMSGNIDLNKKLYDLNLRITPYITASLPVVATIAGGPVAGLATWVASNIINKGMQSISGYTYRVSGPWSDPVVQQVKIYRNH